MKNDNIILLRPLVTEKGTYLQEKHNQYAFQVAKNANKVQIKAAVEERFEVTVTVVRTLNNSGKLKRLGRFTGRRSDWKKAFVTLKEGDKIEYVEGA